jgi:hypothetical protein
LLVARLPIAKLHYLYLHTVLIKLIECVNCVLLFSAVPPSLPYCQFK